MLQHATTCYNTCKHRRCSSEPREFAGIPSSIVFSSNIFEHLPTSPRPCCHLLPIFVASATCSSRRNSNDAFTSERANIRRDSTLARPTTRPVLGMAVLVHCNIRTKGPPVKGIPLSKNALALHMINLKESASLQSV